MTDKTTAAHTPGPWGMERGGGHAGPRIVGAESIHIAGQQRNSLGISSASYSEMICELTGDMDLPGPAANAHLIAAAPALLYTLVHIRDSLIILDGGPATEVLMLVANSAILQAQGKLEQARREVSP